jgi:hypothetical protein
MCQGRLQPRKEKLYTGLRWESELFLCNEKEVLVNITTVKENQRWFLGDQIKSYHDHIDYVHIALQGFRTSSIFWYSKN